MSQLKRKKLIFSVSMSSSAGQFSALASGTIPRGIAFPCTNFTPGFAGDLHGAVLEDFAALPAGAPASIQVEREVSAWFMPTESAAAASQWIGTLLDFVVPTAGIVAFASGFRVAANGAAGVLAATAAYGSQAAGETTLGNQHFAVRLRPLRRSAPAAFTVHGRLYVHRQHSIEV